VIKEAEAIPYEAVRLRGERLLVLAPHPDDEAIGCGGLIAQHLRESRVVHIAVATNGAEAGDLAIREEESRRGVALLGPRAVLEFFRFPDRALESCAAELADRIGELLLSIRPDLVLVPSPIEIHPDHLALSRAFCELIQRHDEIFAALAVATVAFYEVSQPIRPNALVDITDAAVVKWNAIEAHSSQTSVRDYAAYARGLNAYRSMTLPSPALYAEGYWTIPLPKLRTMSFTQLREAVAEPPQITVTREASPVSVIVRTKDRPALLRDAVASIRQYAAAEIVVVNDGGERVEVDGARLIEHAQSQGRSAAANEGVRNASNALIAFLDDDDLHYAEHLPVLTAAAATFPRHQAWYSDAVSAFLHIGESGELETDSRQRLFSSDFDRASLLVDNYIPLPALLMRRDAFLEAGGFDPSFDLFEDWEFLIRLSQRGDFVHVPRVTCEIRHIQGGGSITMQNPEGSRVFRDAKKQVWQKHASLLTHDVFAGAFERQKNLLFSRTNELAGERGRLHHLMTDLARLEREKQELVARIGSTHTEASGAIAELNGIRAALQDALAQRDRNIASLTEENTLQKKDVEAWRARCGDSEKAIQTLTDANAALNAEIIRLNGLLDMIYRSRTWKLHTTLEKLRGRG